MFRKASWFRSHIIGWGISPRCWQGWVYVLVWAVLLLVPFLATTLGGFWFWGSLVFTAAFICMIKDVAAILAELDSQKCKPVKF